MKLAKGFNMKYFYWQNILEKNFDVASFSVKILIHENILYSSEGLL